MKKLLIFFLLILASFISIAQTQKISSGKYDNLETLIDKYGKNYDWYKTNMECYGCASFYIKVMRTTHTIQGNYYYYVYFYSNSFDKYGYLASTYITNMTISIERPQGLYTLINSNYVLVYPKSITFDGIQKVGTFYSASPKESVTIMWGGLSVY